VTTHDWVNAGLTAAAIGGPAVAYLLGRRGRRARASKDEADATESLSASVVALGQRLDTVTLSLWDAYTRLQLAEQRATAAENRAAAAELRAATSDAELVRLRAEVASLRAELAQYDHLDRAV
jgi:hypothetical protein